MSSFARGFRTVVSGKGFPNPVSPQKSNKRRALIIVGACTAGYYCWNLESVPITSNLRHFNRLDRKRFNGLSLAEKKRLADESFSAFYSQNRHLILPAYTAEYKTIKDISERIAEAANEIFGAYSYKPKIFVVQRKEPNALVLPGGEIFVFSGIFRISQNSSELASVVGHEVSINLGTLALSGSRA